MYGAKGHQQCFKSREKREFAGKQLHTVPQTTVAQPMCTIIILF